MPQGVKVGPFLQLQIFENPNENWFGPQKPKCHRRSNRICSKRRPKKAQMSYYSRTWTRVKVIGSSRPLFLKTSRPQNTFGDRGVRQGNHATTNTSTITMIKNATTAGSAAATIANPTNQNYNSSSATSTGTLFKPMKWPLLENTHSESQCPVRLPSRTEVDVAIHAALESTEVKAEKEMTRAMCHGHIVCHYGSQCES